MPCVALQFSFWFGQPAFQFYIFEKGKKAFAFPSLLRNFSYQSSGSPQLLLMIVLHVSGHTVHPLQLFSLFCYFSCAQVVVTFLASTHKVYDVVKEPQLKLGIKIFNNLQLFILLSNNAQREVLRQYSEPWRLGPDSPYMVIFSIVKITLSFA